MGSMNMAESLSCIEWRCFVGSRWCRQWSGYAIERKSTVQIAQFFCHRFNKTVTNHSLIADPTARVRGGFDLPRRLWVLLNGFRTGQGHCAANHATTPGADRQHAVLMWRTTDDVPHCYVCPSTKFPGGLRALHCAGDDAEWLDGRSIR